MRALIAAAVAAVPVALFVAAPATANPAEPPYIERTEWARWGDLSSLRVYPTLSAREAASDLGGAAAEAGQAWTEVLASSPDADMPGMRAQFDCHWRLAEFAEPGKISWNLEPWRPLVDESEMISSGCNPGGTQEPF